MAKNLVQPGHVVEYAAPYAVVSGAGALIGTRFGVAMVTLANAERGNFAMDGVWRIAKATGEAWTEGAKIYWDNTNKRLTTTSASNTLVGTAAAAAASGDTLGNLLIGIVA